MAMEKLEKSFSALEIDDDNISSSDSASDISARVSDHTRDVPKSRNMARKATLKNDMIDDSTSSNTSDISSFELPEIVRNTSTPNAMESMRRHRDLVAESTIILHTVRQLRLKLRYLSLLECIHFQKIASGMPKKTQRLAPQIVTSQNLAAQMLIYQILIHQMLIHQMSRRRNIWSSLHVVEHANVASHRGEAVPNILC
ncbi:unnamed protein product [Ceratitis capitata]|uniref:(Mediterranean fruit fly) hypothetical protein n=1 Tax=Ceratitis capitata TaxID=7213 RepID=A0A811V2F0_CERCA|nr:unnamed protein product [Ceratitis capitata]